MTLLLVQAFSVPESGFCRATARLWATPAKRGVRLGSLERFQHLKQTCRAGFVQFRHGWRSFYSCQRAKAGDGSKDGAHLRSGDGYFGQLESDGIGVVDDAGPDRDQLYLRAGQQPVGQALGNSMQRMKVARLWAGAGR